MKTVEEILETVSTLMNNEGDTNTWGLLKLDLEEVYVKNEELEDEVEDYEDTIEALRKGVIINAENVAMDFYLNERVAFHRLVPFDDNLEPKEEYLYVERKELEDMMIKMYNDIVKAVQ